MTNTFRWMVSCGLMTAGVMVLASGCEPKPETAARQVEEEAATGGVAAANYPLAYFAETLLGGALPVVFDAPGDEDPAFWEPDDAALERIQEARVILMNGAGYSKWAEQASLPASRVVDTSAGFAAQWIEVKAGVTHSHGPEGEHAHAGTAFTTWIDFEQAGRQL
jgi:zinc transport system substrate-binding protein